MFGFLTAGPRDLTDPLISVKSVTQWLRGLPAQDVIGRQQMVLVAFDALRQSRNPVDPARVQAVLFLDAALGADRRQLVKQYVENADSGTQLSHRIWKSAFDLSQGYVSTYQFLLQHALQQSNNPRWKPLVPLLFARLVHFFGTDAKLRVFRYERWIPAKWVELHQVYMRAVELGVDRVPTVLGHGPNTTQWTVEQEYVYVLLIHQLNSGNMSPAELDWAYAQIRGWSRRLSLDAVARSMEGFLVDVGGKTGLVRPAGNDAGLMLRYLDTTPVCSHLDRAIASLRHAETPEGAPALSINQRRITILEKIRPAVAPNLNADKRRDPRHACGVTARVRVGLTRISHELASSGAKDAVPIEAGSHEQIEVYTVADVAPAKRRPHDEHDSIAASLSSFTDPMWHVKDRSVAGLRIGATGGVGQALSLGALVAVRQSDVSEWLLGVVRRLNKISPDEVEGGLAIIADNVVPITLHAKRESKADMGFVVNGVDVSTIGARFDALYLPPPSRPDKPLRVKTMIVPTPEYSDGRQVILTTGRSVYTMVLRHLIEQRADWSWTAVQISDKKPRN
jgi:hypothetical protein